MRSGCSISAASSRCRATSTRPLALRYHGHQFRAYNPRARRRPRLPVRAAARRRDGRLLDLGTKGSGTHALVARRRRPADPQGRRARGAGHRDAGGARASTPRKTFSLIETGEALVRGDEPSPTRSSVLVRLSHSHIRFGSFQRLGLSRGQRRRCSGCSTHAVEPTCPELWRDDAATRAVGLSASGSCAASPRTGARSGWPPASSTACSTPTTSTSPARASTTAPGASCRPTIPDFTAAYFDHTGLYAYGRQPATLLLEPDAAGRVPAAAGAGQAELESRARAASSPRSSASSPRPCCAALACVPPAAADDALAEELFGFLEASRAPFEQIFFDWYGGLASAARADRSPSGEYYAGAAFAPVRTPWRPWSRPRTCAGTAYFGRDRPCTMLDRRGRGALGTDRARRRLVVFACQAGRDRADAGSLRYGGANRLRIEPLSRTPHRLVH